MRKENVMHGVVTRFPKFGEIRVELLRDGAGPYGIGFTDWRGKDERRPLPLITTPRQSSTRPTSSRTRSRRTPPPDFSTR